MIRLYVDAPLAQGAEVALGADHSHYLVNVMRLGVGSIVALFNGEDGEWRAVITQAAKRSVRLSCAEQRAEQRLSPDLELAVAVVKRARLETIVEKAVELGCRRIRLVFTQRTNTERVRLDRLRAIATEAAEQTGRLEVPIVEAPVKLAELLASWPKDRRLLFCDEGGGASPVLEALRGADGPWAILIGPEGGFSDAERSALRSLAFVTPATLGPRILRADTAAISALTLWQATAGDWR